MKDNLTSRLEPIEGASGNMAKPGTKKTGSHFAKKFAPGERLWKTLSLTAGTIKSVRRSRMNKMQHPPNWDGNAMPFAAKSLRNKWSRIMKTNVPPSSLLWLLNAPPRMVEGGEEILLLAPVLLLILESSPFTIKACFSVRCVFSTGANDWRGANCLAPTPFTFFAAVLVKVENKRAKRSQWPRLNFWVVIVVATRKDMIERCTSSIINKYARTISYYFYLTPVLVPVPVQIILAQLHFFLSSTINRSIYVRM